MGVTVSRSRALTRLDENISMRLCLLLAVFRHNGVFRVPHQQGTADEFGCTETELFGVIYDRRETRESFVRAY